MGIDNEYDLPPQMEGSVFEMTDDERAERGIQSLPGSLLEAIQRAEESDCLHRALGGRVLDTLLSNKRTEWERYPHPRHRLRNPRVPAPVVGPRPRRERPILPCVYNLNSV